MTVPPWHKVPSVKPQLAGPPGGEAAHVPRALPAERSQLPLQQSPDAAHASPGCPQNEEAWQYPLLQKPEQQELLDAQGLPSVEHVVLSGAHVPPVQFWLQQSPFAEHAPVSAVQVGYAQT